MAPFQRGAFFAPLTADPAFHRLPAQRKKTVPLSVAWSFLSTTKSYLKEVHKLRLKNKLKTPAPAGKKLRHRFSPAKAAYYAFLSFIMFLMTTQPVYATDVWTKAAHG